MKTLILCADSFQRAQHIQVTKEVEDLKKLLQDRQFATECIYGANLAKIKDAFLQDSNKDFRIFHYSGHAGGEGIELWNTDASGNSLAYAQDLAAYIGSMKTVKMVVLNGCSTMEQIQHFTQAGVPIVVATSRPVQDKIAQAFSSHFYAHLLAGDNLLDAFTKTNHLIGADSDLQTLVQQFRGPQFEEVEETPQKLPLYQLYPAPDSASPVLKATWTQILDAGFPRKEKKVFISYAKKDAEYLEDLEMHLTMLKRHKLIDTWNVGEVEVSQDVNVEVNKEIKTAEIILLLVSAKYLANPDIWDNEITLAVERHKRKEVILIPIILSPCDWEKAPFGGLVTLPRKGEGIVSKMDRDEAFAEIAGELRKILQIQK